MQNFKFKNAYLSIPRIDKRSIKTRDKIVNECKISTTIFYNWLKGITPVPHWAKPIISKIMEKEQTELFPK